MKWQGDTLVFQPEKPWPAGSTIQVRLQPGAQALDFPPLPLRDGVEWSFQIHQPALAYLYPASGPASLYQVGPANGELNLLYDSPSGMLDFTTSLTEPLIYFSERNGTDGSKIYRAWVGKRGAETLNVPKPTEVGLLLEPELVYDCQMAVCSMLALDPGGGYLAFERTNFSDADAPQIPQVWILPLTDGLNAQPFLAGDPGHQTEMPTWSSTGILAFYDRTTQMYLFVEPGKGEKARLPNQTGLVGSWHPDGSAFLTAEIIFLNENVSPELSDLEVLADSHLILFHLDNGRKEDLSPGEGIEDSSPSFSPDGEYLVFGRKYLDVQNWTPGRQIWIARVADKVARPLTDDPIYNHFDFSWGPSSDQLAYVRFNQSSPNEPPQIWVLNLLTGQAVQMVQGGYKPLWIP